MWKEMWKEGEREEDSYWGFLDLWVLHGEKEEFTPKNCMTTWNQEDPQSQPKANCKPNSNWNLTVFLYQFLSLFLNQKLLLCCARGCHTLPV